MLPLSSAAPKKMPIRGRICRFISHRQIRLAVQVVVASRRRKMLAGCLHENPGQRPAGCTVQFQQCGSANGVVGSAVPIDVAKYARRSGIIVVLDLNSASGLAIGGNQSTCRGGFKSSCCSICDGSKRESKWSDTVRKRAEGNVHRFDLVKKLRHLRLLKAAITTWAQR